MTASTMCLRGEHGFCATSGANCGCSCHGKRPRPRQVRAIPRAGRPRGQHAPTAAPVVAPKPRPETTAALEVCTRCGRDVLCLWLPDVVCGPCLRSDAIGAQR